MKLQILPKPLKPEKQFNKLNDKLKYAAFLREKYSDKSLSYIVEQISTDNKISKSGLKHRLDKIVEIAESIG